MRRAVALSLVLAVAAGCAVPSDPKKQAEEIGSVAAEGALLAHDVAEGDTTATFARVHAEALRKKLDELEPKLRRPRLRELAGRVSTGLDRLSSDPADRELARTLEARLDDDAKIAEELAR